MDNIYPDYMIDLEALSTRANAAILSITVVAFDLYVNDSIPALLADESRRHTVIVDLRQQVENYGRCIDASTVYWWLNQSEEARRAISSPSAVLLPLALHSIFDWIKAKYGHGSPFVWGYGATFDNVILVSAVQACGIKHPWGYRNDRCARTLITACDVAEPHGVNLLTPHRSDHDAVYQVVKLQEAYRTLRGTSCLPVQSSQQLSSPSPSSC